MEETVALYVIACCARKAMGGFGPAWSEIERLSERNRFQQLNSARKSLMEFYAGVSSDDADFIYGKNRRDNRKMLRAHLKNKNVMVGPTMPARMRYQGNAYRRIPWMRDQLKGVEPNNVLIMSALMGILDPNDYVPDYELLMSDRLLLESTVKRRVRSVAAFWKEQMKDFKKIFPKIFTDLKYVYCFMSPNTGYVKAVEPLLSEYESYYVKTNRQGVGAITSSWGEGVAQCAGKLVEPRDVRKELGKMKCDLVEI